MLRLTVQRSAQAEEDLIHIWSYVAAITAADRLLDRLRTRWELLATQPRSGAPRPEFGSEIRHIGTGNYVTYYRIVGGDIEILRVLHGHRNVSPDDLSS